MTTTATTTAAGPILALDLGKYKTVACAYHPGTAQARFDALTTSREQLRKLFARERPAAVVIEACLLAGWVHDWCAELGLACHVANTASEAWKFKHIKRKTDRDDARRLAQLFALGQLPTVAAPPWRETTIAAAVCCSGSRPKRTANIAAANWRSRSDRSSVLAIAWRQVSTNRRRRSQAAFVQGIGGAAHVVNTGARKA